MLQGLRCLAKSLVFLANHLKHVKTLGGLACLATFSLYFYISDFLANYDLASENVLPGLVLKIQFGNFKVKVSTKKARHISFL